MEILINFLIVDFQIIAMILAVSKIFFTQINNNACTIHRNYMQYFPTGPTIENFKMLLFVAIGYQFINKMRNFQMAYLRSVQLRMSVKPKETVKRNKPETRTFMYYERTVLKLSATTFRSHFRLTKTTFTNICNLIGPVMAPNLDASRHGRPNTPIEKQILPVLWILATPESYRFVQSILELHCLILINGLYQICCRSI